jgi:NAD(P)-dependent dehydrogenase (short-subunit alcohol dehydrogenase family)
MALPEIATKDGYDVQMQTNHLSHFLLSSLMLPALERSCAEHGEARIVVHTSAARNAFAPDAKLEYKYFERRVGDLGGLEGRWMRYHMSKLANSTFTFALQARSLHLI